VILSRNVSLRPERCAFVDGVLPIFLRMFIVNGSEGGIHKERYDQEVGVIVGCCGGWGW
jgi:hypothetical protein